MPALVSADALAYVREPMFAPLLDLESAGDGRFTAPPSPDKGERMFGGQFLAQCMAAAQATVADDRRVNSLHGYFLRPGDVDLEVGLDVEVVRDGRSFSSRQVVASQRGKELFRALLSYQVPDESPEYVASPMPDVPPPEQVAYTYDDFTLELSGADAWHGSDRPVDIRYINPPTAPRGEPVTETQLMWMRISESLPDASFVHQAALAYLSDTTVVDHVMLPLGMRWQDSGLEGTSLDHAMWFQRPARADEWLLFAQDVEATGGGRGLASGRLYTRDGELAATCVQEGLMRWSTPNTT